MSNLYSRAKEFNELTGYDVKLHIDVRIDSSLSVDGYKNKVNDEQVLSLSVPLTKKVVSISTTNDKSINRSVIDHLEVDEKFNAYLFMLSGLVTLSLIPLTIMSYISLFNLINMDDYYRKLSILKRRYSKFIKIVDKKPDFKNKEVIVSSIEDSYKRLIFPSIEREIRNTLTENAQERAISVFGKNVKTYV
mgnify:CR=1 FL=1